MIKGITTTGFAFEVEDEALDNYELLETLTCIDKGDLTVIPEMLDILLGKEQTAQLKEHVRQQVGRISTKAMMNEVALILGSGNKLKN